MLTSQGIEPDRYLFIYINENQFRPVTIPDIVHIVMR